MSAIGRKADQLALGIAHRFAVEGWPIDAAFLVDTRHAGRLPREADPCLVVSRAGVKEFARAKLSEHGALADRPTPAKFSCRPVLIDALDRQPFGDLVPFEAPYSTSLDVIAGH